MSFFFFPPEFTAGDYLKWTVADPIDKKSNSSATSFSVYCTLLGPSSLSATATAVAGGYLFEIPSSQTVNLAAGLYAYQVYLVSYPGGDKVTLSFGRAKVLPNLATQTAPFNPSSDAEQILVEVQQAIRAVLQGQSYRIGEREVTRANITELIKLESKLRWDIKRERRAEIIASGLPDPMRVWARFSSP